MGLFQRAGFECDVARSGAEAVPGGRHVSYEPGVDGLRDAGHGRLRSGPSRCRQEGAGAHTPIVAMAEPSGTSRQPSTEAGMDDLIRQPPRHEDVQRVLARYITESAGIVKARGGASLKTSPGPGLRIDDPAFAAPAAPSFIRPADPCDSCAEWNARARPSTSSATRTSSRPAGLGSVLVTSDAGHVLLDGALPQSAALIDANIRALRLRTEDVRVIVSSHTHFDHAGGIAWHSSAPAAPPSRPAPRAARARRRARARDPQFVGGTGFPKVKKVRVVADGETLRGRRPLAVTAHSSRPGTRPAAPPGPGAPAKGRAASTSSTPTASTAVSAPGFRFSGDASHPDIVETFRKSIATVEALPCDILLAVHPSFADMDRKLAARARAAAPDPSSTPVPAACMPRMQDRPSNGACKQEK